MNEEVKFNRFLEMVKAEARKRDMYFFLDDGEGNEAELGELFAQNLSGWLIEADKKDEFEAIWKNGDDPGETYDENFTYVVWSQSGDGKITIEFCDSL